MNPEHGMCVGEQRAKDPNGPNYFTEFNPWTSLINYFVI